MVKINALVEVLNGRPVLEVAKKYNQDQVELQRKIIQLKRESHGVYAHNPLKVSMINLLVGD